MPKIMKCIFIFKTRALLKQEGFLAVRCHNNGVAQCDRLWSVNLSYTVRLSPLAVFKKCVLCTFLTFYIGSLWKLCSETQISGLRMIFKVF